jgi:hypothetical protein
MSGPQELHISFRHLDTDYDINLLKGGKSDHSVEINGVSYAVLGEKDKQDTAFKILKSVSLDSISNIEDLKGRLSVREDISFPQAKVTHDIGIQSLHITTSLPTLISSDKVNMETVNEIKMPEIMPHTLVGDRPLGFYQSADESRSIQFLEKDGHLFEIGIGHPEKPTECLLLKDGSFQLKDLPLTFKYDRYADSITIEENEQVIHTFKTRPLNLTETVDKLCISLEKYYIFPEIGKKCSDYLREQLNSGAYKSISDPIKLSEAFTADLLKIADDKHMHVRLPNLQEELSSPPTIKELNGPYSLPDLIEPHHEYKSMLDGGDSYLPYEIKTGLLRDNSEVGYVDFRVFGNCKWKGDKPEEKEDGYDQMMDFGNRKSELVVAVNYVKNAKAIIIDLRNNGGGRDNCVQLMCSLFNDQKKPLSRIEWREGNARKFEDTYTLTEEELPKDQRLLNQTVMVLIGPNTFSAAEAFANDMRALGRAKIVGDSSAGGANPSNGIYKIGEFEFRIPEGEAINPILEKKGERNWEGKGITPDFIVPANDALNKAIALLTTK